MRIQGAKIQRPATAYVTEYSRSRLMQSRQNIAKKRARGTQEYVILKLYMNIHMHHYIKYVKYEIQIKYTEYYT